MTAVDSVTKPPLPAAFVPGAAIVVAVASAVGTPQATMRAGIGGSPAMPTIVRPRPIGTSTLKLFSQGEYDDLLKDIKSLRKSFDELKEQVDSTSYEIVELTYDKAKEAISKYFNDNDGREIYPSDVAAALRLDYDQVMNVIGHLANEGKISKV